MFQKMSGPPTPEGLAWEIQQLLARLRGLPLEQVGDDLDADTELPLVLAVITVSYNVSFSIRLGGRVPIVKIAHLASEVVRSTHG